MVVLCSTVYSVSISFHFFFLSFIFIYFFFFFAILLNNNIVSSEEGQWFKTSVLSLLLSQYGSFERRCVGFQASPVLGHQITGPRKKRTITTPLQQDVDHVTVSTKQTQ